MKKQLYVHCGFAKSGSSFVQDFMYRHELLFNAAGVCLPIGSYQDGLGNFQTEAYLLGEALANCNLPIVDSYIELLLEKGNDKFQKYLISSEYLLGFDSDFLIYFCNSLKHKFDFHFIVYFRDLFDYFFSKYRQEARYTKHLAFDIESLVSYSANEFTAILTLENITENINVISYEKHISDLISPLCDVMNISPLECEKSSLCRRVNRNLGRNLFFLHNSIVRSCENSSLDLLLISNIVANSIKDEPFTFYDEEIARFLYDRYGECLMVWNKYMVKGDLIPSFDNLREPCGSLLAPEEIEFSLVDRYLNCFFSYLKSRDIEA